MVACWLFVLYYVDWLQDIVLDVIDDVECT